MRASFTAPTEVCAPAHELRCVDDDAKAPPPLASGRESVHYDQRERERRVILDDDVSCLSLTERVIGGSANAKSISPLLTAVEDP